MTLIELLIAIAIIGGLFALVWPAMSGALGEWSFQSTLEQIESQLLLARSQAMRTRSPVEVVMTGEGARREVRARPFTAGLRAVEQSEVNAAQRGSSGGNAAPLEMFVEDESADQRAADFGSWARFRLAQGVQILDALPQTITDAPRGR